MSAFKKKIMVKIGLYEHVCPYVFWKNISANRRFMVIQTFFHWIYLLLEQIAITYFFSPFQILFIGEFFLGTQRIFGIFGKK